MCAHFEDTPGLRRSAGKTQGKGKVGARKIAVRLVRPLDQAHGIVPKILAKSGIFKLCCFIETIKIKVIPVYARNYVNFNKGIGWTLDRPDMTERAQ